MNLIKKLDTIDLPYIEKLKSGKAETIAEFWNEFIQPNLPNGAIVREWHKLLKRYIIELGNTYAIRGFNSFPKDKYGELRRGFLTKTNQDYSFFYTDNFFAAYFYKMARDNYVPQYNEFVQLINNRKFPARFGLNTAQERELLAVKNGKDPGINKAGYKLAHIFPVGMNYVDNDKNLNINYILEKYFPKGNRRDWVCERCDGDEFFVRYLNVHEDAKKYLTAHFIRFVHPLNYIMTPKKRCENNCKCNEIAEYNRLLDFAKLKLSETYADIYNEFLEMIMVGDVPFVNEDIGKEIIDIKWGVVNQENIFSKNTVNKPKNQKSNYQNLSKNGLLMALEYLKDPNTSFRKIERNICGIDSQARGGGFVAKKIINDLGVTANLKGILIFKSLNELALETSGKLRETIINIVKILEENKK